MVDGDQETMHEAALELEEESAEQALDVTTRGWTWGSTELPE
jgi:hypothetical protein